MVKLQPNQWNTRTGIGIIGGASEGVHFLV